MARGMHLAAHKRHGVPFHAKHLSTPPAAPLASPPQAGECPPPLASQSFSKTKARRYRCTRRSCKEPLPASFGAARLESIERRAVTPYTVVEIEPLMAQLAQGRELGWYEARDKGTEGVTALAVAGWLGDQPVGISLAGPAERIAKNRENYLAALREVRNSLLADS
ncbi:IclR family transcriptional regulator domain-containing protein [Cupriavidus necator]